MFKTVTLGIGALLLTLAVIFGLNAIGMMSWSFFGKWGEEIRYDIHKESQAYRDGMQRNLAQMQTQYFAADPPGKAAIRAAIKQQYSQTDTSEYPAYLQTFLSDMGIY